MLTKMEKVFEFLVLEFGPGPGEHADAIYLLSIYLSIYGLLGLVRTQH